LRLTVGFNARIDLTLKLGAMEESVTVSGQSPVVDVSSTTASVAFTKEVLDAIPRGRDLQNVFAMAPGVTQAVADVGGSTMAQRQNLFSYGVLSQPKLQVEGMNITMGADQNTAIYFNDSTLEEVQVKSSGNDAEVSVPGIPMVAIMQWGGNTFHGAYQASPETPKPQPDNLNNSLRAQGLTARSRPSCRSSCQRTIAWSMPGSAAPRRSRRTAPDDLRRSSRRGTTRTRRRFRRWSSRAWSVLMFW